MARIRTIKPSFWGDEAVSRLSWDARLLLIGIISLADDDGRFIASQQAVLGHVFPHEEVPTSKWKRLMTEVETTGIIELYNVDGRRYGFLPNWKKHQRINRAQRSSLPEPPAERLWSE